MAMRRLIFSINGGGERFDRRQMKLAQGIRLVRLFVDALEEDFAGRISRGDERDAEQDVMKTENRNRAVKHRRRASRRDQSQASPEITIAPETQESAALPQGIHGGEREAVEQVVRGGHDCERDEQLV